LAGADAVTAGAVTAVTLAEAGRQALNRVLALGADRSVALDLLAADALVTLALLAQAESSPERLGDFAATVLRDVSPPA
jgi:electron transfer flavoprotein alpha/beta subunit